MTERNTTESLKEFLGTFKRRMPKDVFIDMEAALSDIFPQLKESERIRKALLDLFKIENFNGYVTLNGIDVDDVIAWLEKQREKKPKWTEEDDTIRRELIRRMEALDHYWNRPNDQKLIDWIKSIKQRMEG